MVRVLLPLLVLVGCSKEVVECPQVEGDWVEVEEIDIDVLSSQDGVPEHWSARLTGSAEVCEFAHDVPGDVLWGLTREDPGCPGLLSEDAEQPVLNGSGILEADGDADTMLACLYQYDPEPYSTEYTATFETSAGTITAPIVLDSIQRDDTGG